MRIAILLLLLAVSGAQEPGEKTMSGRAEVLYARGMNQLIGAGPSRSEIEAVRNIRSAAELGHRAAQVVLGYFSETGFQMPCSPQHAAFWYRKAAVQRDVLGSWFLGRLYVLGLGVAKDLAEAETWLRPAAERGDPFAQHLLGLVLESRDYSSAPRWFRMAAEQGLPQAQSKLARLLREGHAVAQDKAEAYIWFLLSTEAGATGLEDELRRLEAELGSAAVERAKSEARRMQRHASRRAAAGGCSGWPGEFDEIPAPPPPELHHLCR